MPVPLLVLLSPGLKIAGLIMPDTHGSLAWTSGRRCWGQNVGTGPTVRAVFRAFMRSADHRANMLDRCYRRTGYGVVKFRGAAWVTVNFAG